MYLLDELFTLGDWIVNEGKEDEFMMEWKVFADWSLQNKFGSDTPYLLQDTNNPKHFISFGPWPDLATIQKWRNTPEFQDFLIKTKTLCQKVEPNTLKLVAQGERA